MAIDNNADFTPSIPDSGVVPTKLPYNPTGSFKFWAQKVIPLVYDDSLSYYEVLCKVVTYLNNVIQNVDNLNDSIDSTNENFGTLQNYVNETKDTLINTYNELQDYVNTYFDNLDVQEEINEKLDEMADSGALSILLAPFIPSIVADWLSTHITPTTPAVDNTLSISGAAADAKETGDRITDLRLTRNFETLFNDANLISPMVLNSFNQQGVTLTWSGITGTVEGTAEGSYTSVIHSSPTSLPYGIKAGETYHVKYTSPNLIARFYYYDANSGPTSIISLTGNGDVTIPSDAIGFEVRIVLTSGRTYPRTSFIAPFMYSEQSNLGILEKMASEKATYYPSYQNALVTFYDTGVKPTITRANKTYTIITPRTSYRCIWNNATFNGAPKATTETFELANGYVLIYKPSTDNVEAIHVYDLATQSVPFIILLHNANGNLQGQWAHWYTDGIIETRISNLESNIPNVPSYYDSYLPDKIRRINTIGTGLTLDSVRCIFITDYHSPSNAKNSVSLMRSIIGNTGIRDVTFGGDSYNEEETLIEGYESIVDFTKQMIPIQEESTLRMITGNHDYNNPSSDPEKLSKTLNRSAIYQLYNATMDNIVCLDNTNSFYVDDSVTKTRFYYIDVDYSSNITYETMHSINTSLLDVPEGYKVFMYSHRSLASGSDNTIYGRLQQIMRCAIGMNDGVSVSVNEGSTVTYDFTGKQRDFIGVIGGHSHVDGYGYRDNRFPLIATTCDAYALAVGGVTRTRGTISEQAFDVVQINTYEKIIYCVRIGSGVDRYFHYDYIAVDGSITLTPKLSGTLTWNTSDESIATVENGVVTAVTSGTATIKVTDDSGNFEVFAISVA